LATDGKFLSAVIARKAGYLPAYLIKLLHYYSPVK